MVAVAPPSVPIVLLIVSLGSVVSRVKVCPVPAVVLPAVSIVRTLNVPVPLLSVTPLTVHRMTALEDCDLLEVSTPELDDVVRLEDRYGREGT